jgi:hypothetical protein
MAKMALVAFVVSMIPFTRPPTPAKQNILPSPSFVSFLADKSAILPTSAAPEQAKMSFEAGAQHSVCGPVPSTEAFVCASGTGSGGLSAAWAEAAAVAAAPIAALVRNPRRSTLDAMSLLLCNCTCEVLQLNV